MDTCPTCKQPAPIFCAEVSIEIQISAMSKKKAGEILKKVETAVLENAGIDGVCVVGVSSDLHD